MIAIKAICRPGRIGAGDFAESERDGPNHEARIRQHSARVARDEPVTERERAARNSVAKSVASAASRRRQSGERRAAIARLLLDGPQRFGVIARLASIDSKSLSGLLWDCDWFERVTVGVWELTVEGRAEFACTQEVA